MSGGIQCFMLNVNGLNVDSEGEFELRGFQMYMGGDRWY